MKKLIAIVMLVALCCASVFAADVSAKVTMKYSFGSDGLKFGIYEGTWEPLMALSVNSDVAGATVKVTPIGFSGVALDAQIWFKPGAPSFEAFKFTVGARTNVGTNDRELNGYLIGEFNMDSVDAKVALCFQPDELSWNEGTMYVAGLFNFSIENFGTLHLDGLTSFDVADSKYQFKDVQAEFTYGNYAYNKSSFSGPFDFDTSVYFDEKASWSLRDNCSLPSATTYSVGIRYRYYADESNNGIFGFAKANFLKEDMFSVDTEVEGGAKGASLMLGSRFVSASISGRSLSYSDFAWVDGFEYSLDEAFVFANFSGGSAGSEKFRFDYAKDSGMALTGYYMTSVGIAGLEFNGKVGLDTNYAINWNVGGTATVNF